MDEVFAETADGIGVVQINLLFNHFSLSLPLSLSLYSAFHGFKVWECGMCVGGLVYRLSAGRTPLPL